MIFYAVIGNLRGRTNHFTVFVNTESTKQVTSSHELKRISITILSALSVIFHIIKRISPVILGMVIFTFIYLSKCNNDSNLDGIENFNKGNYTSALKSYNEFLLLHPHDIKTLYNRARCFEVIGDDIKAEMDYNEVLEREPFHVNALLGLSQIFYRKDDFQATINLAESALMVDDQNYLAYYYAGRAYHKVGYWLSALKCYNNVIELNPDYGYAYFHRSSVMISIGLTPLGCNDLQAAVSLNVDGAQEALEKYCGD